MREDRPNDTVAIFGPTPKTNSKYEARNPKQIQIQQFRISRTAVSSTV